ncbi:multicopper oxidase family protein [Sutcliffiella deserti]|uniref:multicopper oxidase family protein n=1 Tax=Sutcliffiella deserti TaxID=2875501 RepID=UPI001CBBD907|nr:multicopper oxidase domain-containing protein [Sutcliffiella deserti]
MTKVKKYLLYFIIAISFIIVCTAGFMAWTFVSSKTSTVGELSFDNPLRIPELLEPTIDSEGRKVFDLTFNNGEVEFIDGKITKTWGISAPYLAPTLRAERGDEVVVNIKNDVNEPTTLHWHGMILPAEMDGGPHQLISPGKVWSPTWTISQPASTTWFHPHLHGETAEHVYRGAAGLFILDDKESNELNLPDDYGINDIPLIVQDKSFNNDGSMSNESKIFSNVGILGDEILVNGTHSPNFEATTNLVRLRILNASTARVYNFEFDDKRTYQLIATDGGLVETPVEIESLLLSPGERAEIVVPIKPNDSVVLQSNSPDLESPFWSQRYNGGDDTFDILKIQSGNDLTELPMIPSELVKIDWPLPSDVVETRHFELTGTSLINGKEMDMNRVDEVVVAGTTEIWKLVNPREETYHNFHAHGIHFSVLDVNGEEPPEYLKGWKDTVYLPPTGKVTVIARFESYVNHEVPYMFHCHILMHEDQGMMGQFIVVEPGANPEKTLPSHDHTHNH